MSVLDSTFKRGLIAAGLVMVLGASAASMAAAQTATPTPAATQQASPNQQNFLDALARRLGITTDALQQAMTQARTDAGLPADARGLPGFGRGDRGGRLGGRGADATVAAQAIGISVDQLRQELPGKSLADVAQAHGKNPSDVATALKNAANQRVDQAVSEGRLTADQAAQPKQEAATRIDQQMTQVVPQGGPGPRPATP